MIARTLSCADPTSDRAELDRALAASRDDLYGFALALTGDHEQAEDLAQEATLRALERHDEGKRAPATRGFLRGLVRTSAAGEARRQEIRRLHESTGEARPRLACDPTVEAAVRKERRAFLAAAVARLSPAQRRAIEHLDLEGCRPRSAARDTGVTATALMFARECGLARLRRSLRGADPDACTFVADSLVWRRHAGA